MNPERRLILVFAGIGLVLIAAGLLPLAAFAQEATTEPAPAATPEATTMYELGAPPIEPTGDNSYCAVCHSLPWRVATLGDGTQLNMYVPASTIANSVHGGNSGSPALGCVDCHGNNFPHGATPDTAREYALQAVNSCVNCHQNEAADLQVGLHEQAIMAGNLDAAVCTDCHGSHNVQAVVEQADLIAGVCGTCHEGTYDEWRVSAHVDLGPLGCATCHSPHTQMIRGGVEANELCLSCHGEKMPDLWVHSNHLAEETGVGCVDCHMYPDNPAAGPQIIPVSVEERRTGHSMHVGTVACTTCHEEQAAQIVTLVEGPPDVAAQQAAAHPEQDTTSTSTVTLLQGLLVGLGIGATAAAIIVARGNKRT